MSRSVMVAEPGPDLEYDASKRDGPTDDVENQQRVVQREIRWCRHARPAGIQAQIWRQGECHEDNDQECQRHYPRSLPPADWSPVGRARRVYFCVCVHHTQKRIKYAFLEWHRGRCDCRGRAAGKPATALESCRTSESAPNTSESGPN